MNAMTQHQPAGAIALQSDMQSVRDALRNSLYPGAADASVEMVLAYCRAAQLDPMTKPVHIVPMWDKNAKQMRDVVMPGIELYRTKAHRTAQHGGMDAATFGKMLTATLDGVTIDYPEFCTVTVYRFCNGVRVPFPATAYWMESYATDRKDSKAPNAMWRKRPVSQLEKCFDQETEVLTTNGFERFDSVSGRVLQVTESGLEACDAVPFVQDYDGEMIVVDGTQLNFSVTPNHDMVTSLGRIEAGRMWELATSDQTKIHIPRAPQNSRADNPKYTDSQLLLAGAVLADGSIAYNTAKIAVSREWKIGALLEIGIHRDVQIKRDAGRVAVAGSRSIVTRSDKSAFIYDYELVSGLVGRDKRLNTAEVLSLSARQARLLVDSLVYFDGSDNGNGVRRLSQKNQFVIRGFEVAAVHAGYSVSAPSARKSDIGDSASLTISDARTFPVYKSGTAAGLVKRKNVAGKVWCVTVPSGVIVVRRHGFSMLCGNCAEALALRKAFPEAVGAQPTAEEMEGREFESSGSAPVTAVQSRAERQPYPEVDFATNLPRWRAAIEAGKKSADDIVAMVESKGTLTDEQKQQIRASVDQEQVEDAQ